MKKQKPFYVVDLFCGAGGSSTGIKRALRRLDVRPHFTVVNHWSQAIDTHKANHPDVEHLCNELDDLDPRESTPEGYTDLLWASPSCVGHSNAAGGIPRSEQQRTGADDVLKWAIALNARVVIGENVREFLKWKPLTKKGRPDNRYRNGHLFDGWWARFQEAGYTAEWRLLTSADYGDPTTRERLFMVFRLNGERARWPRKTHSARPLPGRRRYVPARDVIDWSHKGRSIFGRKKPLAKNTIRRIAHGLVKFGGRNAEPFLAILRGTGLSRGLDLPVPAITARGNHLALVEPFVIGQQSGAAPRSAERPLPTVAGAGAISLVEPFVMTTEHGGKVDNIGQPMKTITSADAWSVCEPFLVKYHGHHAGKSDGDKRVHSVDAPLPTVDTANRYFLCDPFITPQFTEREGQKPRTHSVDSPLPTVTGHGGGALVQPYILDVNHGGKDGRAHSMGKPIGTITALNGRALVEPAAFLVKAYGTGRSASINAPVPTITAKDRFGLVQLATGELCALDILFRMLEPRELALAMGFPKTYIFLGTRRDQVKQIGNAVTVNLSEALVFANAAPLVAAS